MRVRSFGNNGNIDVNGITLRSLITIASDLNNTIPVVGAPARLDKDLWDIEPKCWTINQEPMETLPSR